MSSIAFSYKEFIDSYKSFRKVDRDGINRFDTPAALYFKPFFYFADEYGLLGLNNIYFSGASAFEEASAKWTSETVRKNLFPDTAFSYLCINGETERVKLLKRFLLLLSEISTNSPWYFKSVGGLDAALERNMFGKDFKIEEERKSITIECLEDAYDQRIGTLLDLYRAICWSYQTKREILPANLRKFNMGIMLFNVPLKGYYDKDVQMTIPGDDMSKYISNTKLIELRNCEIDINSSKSAYGTLTSEEPMSPKYTITIYFDDAYESRYNDILQDVVSDFISADLGVKDTASEKKGNSAVQDSLTDIAGDVTNIASEVQNSIANKNLYGDLLVNAAEERVKNEIDVQKNITNKNIFSNLVDSVEANVKSEVKSIVNKLYMGNIYGLSISSAVDTYNKLKNGNVLGAIGDIANTIADNTSGTAAASLSGKKIYEKVEQVKNEIKGNLYPISSKTTKLSYINTKKSIYNNL